MTNYLGATICKGGHILSYTEKSPNKQCKYCYEALITTCPHCGADIQGLEDIPDLCFSGNDTYILPKYCYECGHPYPWEETAINSIRDAILDIEDLNPEEIERFLPLVPDMRVETPKSILAKARMQRLISNASKQGKTVLLEIISKFAYAGFKAFFDSMQEH